ncbi:MAG: flagellar motor protein MotA [Rhodobacteraceae bacterium]|nr:MAG: flagellar motor protein MotA [Paracoccaceae bacterium]
MILRAPATVAVLFLATTYVSAQDSAAPSLPAPAVETLTAPDLMVPQIGSASQHVPVSPVASTVPVDLAKPAVADRPMQTDDSALPAILNTSAPSVHTVAPTSGQHTQADVAPVDVTTVTATNTIAPENLQVDLMEKAEDAWNTSYKFLENGGPSIWAIAGLAVITLALILWKIWRLALIGAWSRGKAGKAVDAFERGDAGAALSIVNGRIGIRSKVVEAALKSVRDMPENRAREETTRVAKLQLAQANVGLGALELIATIAPLLGLLGTVLGMIAAFQALQEAGSKADPALLAGGIWEALLTTAAGMAVAIPASAALTWFESVISRIRRDVEDSSTRIFVAQQPNPLSMAAE